MTYDVIVVNVGDWLWQIDVTVTGDDGIEVLTGQTTVACETEEQAKDYAENVYMPDLRRNFERKIGDLVLKCDPPVVEELPPESGEIV